MDIETRSNLDLAPLADKNVSALGDVLNGASTAKPRKAVDEDQIMAWLEQLDGDDDLI